MHLFQRDRRLNPGRFMAQRKDGATGGGKDLVSCAFVERPGPESSVYAQYNPVGSRFNSRFQDLLRQLSRRHNRAWTGTQFCP